MKLLLMSLSLLGLGAIGGYMTFHVLLSSRCSHLLVETESRQTLKLKELQLKHQKVTDDYIKCTQEEGTKQQLLELQGRLEAQSVLAERHAQLTMQVEELQREQQRVLDMQREEHDKELQEQRHVQEELQRQLKQALDALLLTTASSSANGGSGSAAADAATALVVTSSLQSELELAQRQMDVIKHDMEHFRERLEICTTDRYRAQEQVTALEATLQEREDVLAHVTQHLEQYQATEAEAAAEAADYEHRRRREEEGGEEYEYEQEEEEEEAEERRRRELEEGGGGEVGEYEERGGEEEHHEQQPQQHWEGEEAEESHHHHHHGEEL